MEPHRLMKEITTVPPAHGRIPSYHKWVMLDDLIEQMND